MHNISQIFHGNIWDCAKLWGCPKNALPVLSSNHKEDGQQQQTTTLCVAPVSGENDTWRYSGLWLANIGKKKMIGKISSGLWGNFLGTNQLSIVWTPPERCCWPCPSIYEYSCGYFQQPCHRTLIIWNWFSSTWQWVRCIPMASTVTRSHSGREPLQNKAKWEISDNCLNVVAKSGMDVFLWRF